MNSKNSSQNVVTPTPVKTSRGPRLMLWTALLALASGAAGYYAYQYGLEQNQDAADERDRFKRSYKQLVKDHSALKQQAIIYKQSGVVEKKASEQVRQENIKLQNRVAELEKEVSFFRGIMSPEGRKTGLVVSSATFVPAGKPGRYRFKVVLTQVANRHNTLRGRLSATLHGMQDDKPKTVSLAKLSDEVGINGASFKFRYFQNIEGYLVIPETFIPEKIEVVAKVNGRRGPKRVETFTWPP